MNVSAECCCTCSVLARCLVFHVMWEQPSAAGHRLYTLLPLCMCGEGIWCCLFVCACLRAHLLAGTTKSTPVQLRLAAGFQILHAQARARGHALGELSNSRVCLCLPFSVISPFGDPCLGANGPCDPPERKFSSGQIGKCRVMLRAVLCCMCGAVAKSCPVRCAVSHGPCCALCCVP